MRPQGQRGRIFEAENFEQREEEYTGRDRERRLRRRRQTYFGQYLANTEKKLRAASRVRRRLRGGGNGPSYMPAY